MFIRRILLLVTIFILAVVAFMGCHKDPLDYGNVGVLNLNLQRGYKTMNKGALESFDARVTIYYSEKDTISYNCRFIDTNGDGLYNNDVKDSIRLSAPIDYIVTTTHSAEDAYEKVLRYAGASLHRDSYDELMVSDTRNGLATYTGAGNHKGIIDSQEDNKPTDAGDDWSAWPVLNSLTAPADSDGDGMPDNWETAHGLNASDASDGAIIGADGYTNLENYLNSLVADITEAQYEGGTQSGSIESEGEAPAVSVFELSPATSNGDWTFNNGFSISTSKGYAEGSGCGIKGIKYSRNENYKIIIPDGLFVTQVEVTGYSNVNDETAYLSQLGSNVYGESDYVFPSRTDNVTATHKVTLPEPITGQMSFIVRGQQCVCNLNLYAVTAGVQELSYSTSEGRDVYSIDGRLLLRKASASQISALPKDIYIIGKQKIVKR